MYLDARCPRRWIPTHLIGTGVSQPLSFLIKEKEKKYLHSLKWGSIPRYPSHITMKAVMCWIPLGSSVVAQSDSGAVDLGRMGGEES